MSDGKHSPTPWTVDRWGRVLDANGKDVRLIALPGFGGQRARGLPNQQFGLRAVNSHDALVAVARVYLENCDHAAAPCDRCDQARAALAAAGATP